MIWDGKAPAEPNCREVLAEMRRVKRFALIFTAVVLCLIVIVSFVSVMYPWSRISVFRLLPDVALLVIPESVLIFSSKRVFRRSARLQGFQVRWMKPGENVAFMDNIAISLANIGKGAEKFRSYYARIEAFKEDDGSTLWTCTIPNPLWEKGESTEWDLLTRDNEVWVIATNAGQINALDYRTGKLMWRYDFGFPIEIEQQGKQVVFVRHREGIFCFEPKAKRVLWEICEESAHIEIKVIDQWLQVFVNPYGNKLAYTRWFSLEDGKPLGRPPEVKRQKGKEIPECVKQWLKPYKEASIIGQKGDVFLIGAEIETEKLIAVNAESGEVKWEAKTEISLAHCCGHNYQIAFADKFLFYCVTSNHTFHPGEGSQLLAVEMETGKIVAKAEWISPFDKRRDIIRIVKVDNEGVIVASGFWFFCRLELIAK